MSNSALSCLRVISPNRNSPRNHAIDTITIHCVVGQMGVEALCSHFSNPGLGASCNYGIGPDGRICTIVDESDRSWCSSSAANDNRAITIECASDAFYPYAINANVWKSLIELCADICRRNGIKKLVWSTDKNTRMNHLNGCNLTVQSGSMRIWRGGFHQNVDTVINGEIKSVGIPRISMVELGQNLYHVSPFEKILNSEIRTEKTELPIGSTIT